MYHTYFNLRKEPFELTSDPSFLYANAIYREAYAGLLYGIRQRKGLVVLTGEAGLGKTTLLQALMNHAEATVRWVYICQEFPTFDELLDFICKELGLILEHVGRLQTLQTLHNFLLQQNQLGGTTVLIIDEAQILGEEQLEHLRLLLNLETPTDKLLQIVLVGQPALEQQLEKPSLYQLKQRVALQRCLTRLTEREVGAYIVHRLQVAGDPHRGLFTRKAMQRIAQYADGIPRVVNVLCDNALLHAYGASRRRVTADMIDEVAADHLFVARSTAPGEDHRPGQWRDRDVTPEDSEAKPPIRVGAKRWRFVWAGVVSLLVLLLIGGIYSTQVRGHVVHLTLQIKTLLERALELLDMWL